MTKAPKRFHIPEFDHLRTVKQLCAEYPQLFSEGGLRWLIFNAETNDFGSCIIRMGRRLFIDTIALRIWLAKHRDQELPKGASEITERCTAEKNRAA